MTVMTSLDSLAQRRYQVFFKAPAILSAPTFFKTYDHHYVDAGIAEQEAGRLNGTELRRHLVRATAAYNWLVLSFFAALALALFAAIGLSAGLSHPLVLIITAPVAAVTGALVSLWHMRLKRIRNNAERTKSELMANGRLAAVDDLLDDAFDDILRIHRALRILEPQTPPHDDRARAAVRAVLERELHRPSARQREMAERSAVDESTAGVRQQIAGSDARWHADSALAESLILRLEFAAGVRQKESTPNR